MCSWHSHTPSRALCAAPLPSLVAEGGSVSACAAFCAAGKFVVVLDDEDRENEGDLIINADKVTTEAMAFMVEHTSGVVS